MIRNARIYVADVIDQVVVEATVWSLDARTCNPTEQIVYTAQCNSVGEDSTAEWLKDALIALIETL